MKAKRKPSVNLVLFSINRTEIKGGYGTHRYYCFAHAVRAIIREDVTIEVQIVNSSEYNKIVMRCEDCYFGRLLSI